MAAVVPPQLPMFANERGLLESESCTSPPRVCANFLACQERGHKAAGCCTLRVKGCLSACTTAVCFRPQASVSS